MAQLAPQRKVGQSGRRAPQLTCNARRADARTCRNRPWHRIDIYGVVGAVGVATVREWRQRANSTAMNSAQATPSPRPAIVSLG